MNPKENPMKKAIWLILVLMLLLALPGSLTAGHRLEIRMAFYSGSGSLDEAVPQVVTACRVKPIFQGPIEIDPAEEKSEIRRLEKVFNLARVFLVNHDLLVWDSAATAELEKFVLMGGREYRISLAPVSLNGSYKFRIGVAVKGDASESGRLVDSEIVLTEKQPAVIGFQGDSRGAPHHFLSLRILKASETPDTGLPLRRLAKEKRPKLTKKVAPVYPPEAIEKRIEGTIVVEATTDEGGKVKALRVVDSPDALLSEAALAALRQWEYEPFVVDGKPCPVSFTVTVTFALNKKKEPERIATLLKPQILKKTPPVYPEAAFKAGVEGPVVLEATIDESGSVTDARVLESGNADLSKAAIEAVRQWKYRPYLFNGVAKPATCRVTVTFRLDKEKEKK